MSHAGVSLLLNESMPRTLARRLREGGHDVIAVEEVTRGADETAVLARAPAEARLLVTQDKYFGELAFRHGPPAECGVVLFGLAGEDADTDVRRQLHALESRSDWAGHFAVVSEDRVRLRPLPRAARE